jgi:uncharacterized protein YjbI with pentapeptide repeats
LPTQQRKPWHSRAEEVSAEARRTAEQLLLAVNDASPGVRNLYLTVLGFCLFTLLVTSGLSDEKLLLDAPVPLPLIEKVDLPLSVFYALAPILLILMHAELLHTMALLARKVHALRQKLTVSAPTAAADNAGLRDRVTNFPFVHWALGDSEYHSLQSAIVWGTMLFLPAAVILYAQLGFLPYHGHIIIWSQRFAILSDCLLLAIFWPGLRGSDRDQPWWSWWAHSTRTLLKSRSWRWQAPWWVKVSDSDAGATRLIAFFVIVTTCSFLLLTLPGETLEKLVAAKSSRASRWTARHLHRNLNVTELALDANGPLKPEVIAKLKVRDPSERRLALSAIRALSLRDRDLRNANMSRSILPRVDLRGADLSAAFLWQAVMPEAIADEHTDLTHAVLDEADLQNVQFSGVRLNAATLGNAYLEGAKLEGASLVGASLYGAHLQGARLQRANLTAARLDGAQLQGARLEKSILWGAGLSRAHLQAASLESADLTLAQVDGTDFTGASLIHITLTGVQQQNANWSLTQGRVLITNAIPPNLPRSINSARWQRLLHKRTQIWPSPPPDPESSDCRNVDIDCRDERSNRLKAGDLPNLLTPLVCRFDAGDDAFAPSAIAQALAESDIPRDIDEDLRTKEFLEEVSPGASLRTEDSDRMSQYIHVLRAISLARQLDAPNCAGFTSFPTEQAEELRSWTPRTLTPRLPKAD